MGRYITDLMRRKFLTSARPVEPPRHWRLAAFGYGIGLCLGIAGAVYVLVTDRDQPALAAQGAAARVNGVPIGLDVYQTVLGGLASDKRNDLSADDRAHALSVLIDEELLFQAGLADGLVRADPDLRKRVVNAVLRRINAQADGETISEETLVTYFNDNRDYFAPAAQVQVALFFLSEQLKSEADRLIQRLKAGESLDDQPGLQRALPEAMVPVDRLAAQIGHSAARLIATSPTGTVIGPIPAPGGLYLGQIKARVPGTVPEFQAVRSSVEAEFRRRRADTLLADYLSTLRRRALIERVKP
jgi:hypothetical protein